MSSNKKKIFGFAYQNAKKTVVFVLGTTIVLIGMALLFLPGPGIPLIVAGFALLALEFAWAKVFLERMKTKAKDRIKKWNTKSS